MRMKQWPLATKVEAMAIAAATNLEAASRQTGVPAKTIQRWRSEAVRKGADGSEEEERYKHRLEALQAEALDRAVAEAGEYIAGRLKGLADRLYDLADIAVDKIAAAIGGAKGGPAGTGEPHNHAGAAWVRSLVGVMAQALEKAQLLSGQPTARPEVNNRHEYDITERIIEAHPDVIDIIFPRDGQAGEGNRGR